MTTQGRLDARFSQTEEPTPWSTVAELLEQAELYWLSTTRADGRPHVTPLVGLWADDSFVFCTGPDEQKARNLGHRPAVAVTTGTNRWQDGLDVVVEGTVERVTGRSALISLADAYREKYSGAWEFGVDGDAFVNDESGRALVFRVTPAKVIGYAKSPHGQTTFRTTGATGGG